MVFVASGRCAVSGGGRPPALRSCRPGPLNLPALRLSHTTASFTAGRPVPSTAAPQVRHRRSRPPPVDRPQFRHPIGPALLTSADSACDNPDLVASNRWNSASVPFTATSSLRSSMGRGRAGRPFRPGAIAMAGNRAGLRTPEPTVM
jgi:hypothetical protein